MALLRWILSFLTAIMVTVFAVQNRHSVSVNWSPVHDPFDVPVYLVALGFLAMGFILGAVMSWLGSGSGRKRRRAQRRHIKKLEGELETLSTAKANDSPPAELFPAIPKKIAR